MSQQVSGCLRHLLVGLQHPVLSRAFVQVFRVSLQLDQSSLQIPSTDHEPLGLCLTAVAKKHYLPGSASVTSGHLLRALGPGKASQVQLQHNFSLSAPSSGKFCVAICKNAPQFLLLSKMKYFAT